MTKTELSDLIDKRSERADYFEDATHVLHLADAEKIAVQYAKDQSIALLNWMYAGAVESKQCATLPSELRRMWLMDLNTTYKDSEALYDAFLQQQLIK